MYTTVPHLPSGIDFVFKHDPDAPELLHIYARHMTTPFDAIKAFFTGARRWNAAHQRFETTNRTHTVTWFWLEEGRTVMVISCYAREDTP